jgi:hypothetical protein
LFGLLGNYNVFVFLVGKQSQGKVYTLCHNGALVLQSGVAAH